ncbi:MAG TPA: hypothetical protein VFA47_11635, partial [Candidatus Manganitrophaceae bacterium]|nr:hypothetical protein [Candidatus Manganitrophaceae bacterium]
IRIAADHAEFIAQVEQIINHEKTGPSAERSQTMEKESWDDKVDLLSRFLEERIDLDLTLEGETPEKLAMSHQQ